MSNRFLKLVLSERSDRLMNDLNAFLILMKCASRANRFEQVNHYGFGQFQCGIGKNDFPTLTKKEYRGAKQRLTRGRYAKFEGHTTGTLVTLMDATVWDINPDEGHPKGTEAKQGGLSTETNGAPNKNKEKNKEKEIIHIVDFLNKTCHKNFKHTTPSTVKSIKGRLEEGYTLEDFERVIKIKSEKWAGTKMEEYLTPGTLFRPANFEKYAQENEASVNSNNPLDFDKFMEKNRQRVNRLQNAH